MLQTEMLLPARFLLLSAPLLPLSLHLFSLSLSLSVTPSTTSFCCCACEFVWLSPQWAAACEMQPNPQAAAIQIALPSAQRKSNCRLPSSLPFSSLSSPPSSLCVQCCLINACLRVWAAPLNTHNLLMKLNVFILWKLMEIFAWPIKDESQTFKDAKRGIA